MPEEKSPTSENPTPEGTEPGTDADGKPIPADDGAASPKVEGEGATGPTEGEGQDDPFANVPFEQIQERYGADLERLGETRFELGRRKGQGDSDTAHQKKMTEWQQNQEAVSVFQELSAKGRSQDPDQRDEFAQAMQDDRTASLYEQGKNATRGPNVEEMVGQATSNVIVEVQAFILKEPEMQNLTADERARIDKERKGADGQFHFGTLGAIVKEQMALWREKVKAAAKGKASETEIDAAVKVAEEALLNKLGLEPSNVGGRSEPSGSKAQIQQQYNDGAIDTATYKARLEAIGEKP